MLILICFSPLPLFAVDSQVAEIIKTFPQRQQTCLHEIAGSVHAATSIQGIANLFLQEEIPAANAALREWTSSDPVLLSYFAYLRLLFAFPNQPERLYPETRAHIEQQITQFITRSEKERQTQSADSWVLENREILQTSFLYLWANHIQATSLPFEWPDKKDTQHHVDSQSEVIIRWLDTRAGFSVPDRSSPYYYYDMIALINLRDFAGSKLIQQKAEAILHLLVADMAQESLHGTWGGARCRAFENLFPLPGNRLHYLFFNTQSYEISSTGVDPSTLHFAHSSYCPPAVLVGIGSQFLTRGTYEIKNRFPPTSQAIEERKSAYKYAYITPKYILGSFYLRDEAVPTHTRPWDLLLFDGAIPIHLFTFTGENLFSGGKPPFDSETFLWNSTCLQYKNVLFCRFGRSDRWMPATSTLKARTDSRFIQLPTRVWVPNALSPLTQQDEWCFGRFKTLYIAFRSLHGKNYWWRTATIPDDDQPGSSILGFQDLSPGFLLEIEEAENFSSFETFKYQIMHSSVTMDNQSVTYLSRQGDTIHFPLDDGPFIVNSKQVSPPDTVDYQLFSSPFIHSEYGSKILTANWKDETLLIDLRDPMKPIIQTSPKK